MTVIDTLERIGVVPVVVIDRADDAIPLVEALALGGIPCAEITLRTPGGEAAIAAAAALADVCIGAGTVTGPEDARRAVAAGARFLVSPGLTRDLVDEARTLGVPLVPGVATASEVQQARSLGLTSLKLFPAGILGGVRLIDALAGPFADVRFMPSGGVDLADARAYHRHPAVFAVAGSWMVPRDAIHRGDWGRVQQLAAESVAALAVESWPGDV